jgi:TonB family protein
MLPGTQKRKVQNSSKVNLLISLTFHTIIVLCVLYFAAREGLLGKQMRKIAVEMVKEKPPEKPKEPEKPKVEPPKVEPPKLVEAPKVEPPKSVAQAPPPSATMAAPPAVAPPATEVSSFVFEGGKMVESSSDPAQLYKGLLEYSLRSRWDRPQDMDDQNFEADVQVAVDSTGQISNPVWKKSSGDKRWDDTVRQALAKTQSVNRAPPANFPARVTIRFDVVPCEPVTP